MLSRTLSALVAGENSMPGDVGSHPGRDLEWRLAHAVGVSLGIASLLLIGAST